MLRIIVHALIRFLLAVLTRVDVAGKENVPKSGGAIFAINHLSIIDAPLVFALLDRKDLTAMVADKYQKNFWISTLVNAVNGIWINREEADIQALRAARDYLRKGHALGIAPEGTRSHAGGMIPAKTGVAYLADKAGVPVIPVAIWGTEKAVAQLKRLRRAEIHVRFGKPLDLPKLERADREAVLQHNTDRIMCSIARMLPEQYRGVYTGHPCLEALLAEQEPHESQPVRHS
jgi:1-acyl-sn-glycerol-3-phosphate acyltransferase